MNETWKIYVAKDLSKNLYVYVGQTKRDFQLRVNEHLRDARGKRKNKSVLHYAIAKHGEENYEWSLLSEDLKTLEEANHHEAYWVSFLRTRIVGYNLTDGGDGIAGHHHNEETRNRMRLSQLGKTHTIETRKRLSASKKGKPGIPRSVEARAKISKAKKGCTLTAEHLAKMSKPRSEIGRRNILIAQQKRRLREQLERETNAVAPVNKA